MLDQLHIYVLPRSALQAALSVSQHHRAATRAWNSSGSSSGGSDIRQVPLGQTYYADPLNLSPLHQMPYLFVACARRMLGDLGLSGSGSSSSLSGGGEVGMKEECCKLHARAAAVVMLCIECWNVHGRQYASECPRLATTTSISSAMCCVLCCALLLRVLLAVGRHEPGWRAVHGSRASTQQQQHWRHFS